MDPLSNWIVSNEKFKKWNSRGHPANSETSKNRLTLPPSKKIGNQKLQAHKQKEAALQKQFKSELLTWKKGSKRAIVTFMKKIKKKKCKEANTHSQRWRALGMLKLNQI
uniref:(northern house mosquito) hypothetical protein n=1 Tax=Culex pipiens TaxID=7175 RepID=A0A8D8KE62_CULPI